MPAGSARQSWVEPRIGTDNEGGGIGDGLLCSASLDIRWTDKSVLRKRDAHQETHGDSAVTG